MKLTNHWPEILMLGFLVVGLAVTIVWGMRSSSNDRTLVITGGLTAMLVLVTSVYVVRTAQQAEASRRMAAEMERSKSYTVHPFVIISPHLGIVEKSRSETSNTPINLNSITVVNDGLGPALNGELAFKAKGTKLDSMRLPPLKPSIGFHLPVPKDLQNPEGTSPEDWKSIDQLLISYEDLFRYYHETVVEVEHDGGAGHMFRIKETRHMCLGRDAEKKEQHS